MAIPLLEEILTNMVNKVTGYSDNNTRSVFNFAHAETVTPLVALLKLPESVDGYSLTANLEEKYVEKRKWRMSEISPFSSNLMFALLKKDEKYYVKLYLNQKPVKTHACPTKTICEFDTFTNYYYDIINDFDYNATCQN